MVHGTQEYVLERPLRVGETLVLSPSLESVRVRAGTGFLTIRVDVRDEAGAPVGTARAMMIERGPDA